MCNSSLHFWHPSPAGFQNRLSQSVWLQPDNMVRLQTRSWETSRKHPKLLPQKNLLFKIRKTEKDSIFLLLFVSQEISVSSFPPDPHQKPLDILFLKNGDSVFQSFDCKSTSQQGPSMILSTKMVGQNLKTALRFCIESWHLRSSILAQVS